MLGLSSLMRMLQNKVKKKKNWDLFTKKLKSMLTYVYFVMVWNF